MYFIMKEKESHSTCKVCLSLMLDVGASYMEEKYPSNRRTLEGVTAFR